MEEEVYQLYKSGSSLNCRLYTLSSQQPSYLNLRQNHFSRVITMINRKRKRRRRGGGRWWRKGGVEEEVNRKRQRKEECRRQRRTRGGRRWS